jgi:hypothetical protein
MKAILSKIIGEYRRLEVPLQAKCIDKNTYFVYIFILNTNRHKSRETVSKETLQLARTRDLENKKE